MSYKCRRYKPLINLDFKLWTVSRMANRPPKLLAMGLHLYYSEIGTLVKGR